MDMCTCALLVRFRKAIGSRKSKGRSKEVKGASVAAVSSDPLEVSDQVGMLLMHSFGHPRVSSHVTAVSSYAAAASLAR